MSRRRDRPRSRCAVHVGRRHATGRSDVVETWSHVGILVGHATMMLAWWRFYDLGYPGVREALAALAG